MDKLIKADPKVVKAEKKAENKERAEKREFRRKARYESRKVNQPTKALDRTNSPLCNLIGLIRHPERQRLSRPKRRSLIRGHG